MHTATVDIRHMPPTFAAYRTPAEQPVVRAACSACANRGRCLPSELPADETPELDRLRIGHRRVAAGATLVHGGDAFRFIYAVGSGAFKSVLLRREGEEQVIGFHLPGDVVALEGPGHGRHAAALIALEDSEACPVPYASLQHLAGTHPGFRQLLPRLMSREIVRERGLMALLGSMNAEQRLAAFLLDLAERAGGGSAAAVDLSLPMSRADIGSYLGVRLETVSRAFSFLQEQDLVQVAKKHVRIRQPGRLAAFLAGRQA